MRPLVSREPALAHRLAAHGLTHREPSGAWTRAGALGVSDTMSGSALHGFHVRMEGVSEEGLLAEMRAGRLVTTWGLRSAPRVVPAQDLAPFTTALLPRSDEDVKPLLGSYAKELSENGFSPYEAFTAAADALEAALEDGPLEKGDASAEATRRAPEGLRRWCRGCGVAHIPDTLFRLAARRGTVLLSPGEGRGTMLELGARPRADPVAAGRELARRFLHAYGPATESDLAEWAGVSRAQAAALWEALAKERVEVAFGGAPAWVLREDLPAFEEAALPEGVVLLPAYDAYLEQRDRDTLVPDRARQKDVWKVLGNPGVLLVDGEVAGTWRATKKGRALAVALTPFGRLRAGARDEARAGAEGLAALRGCAKVDVAFEG